MAYFPAFVEIENRPVLIVGGGKAALRKIEILLEFGAEITVISPVFIEEIQKIASENVKRYERGFRISDVEGMHMVIAATESRDVNHVIANACKERKILVNAVDQIEDCTFIFPSCLKQGELVAAFSSSGKSPVVTQYLKEQNQAIVTKELGELAELLGSLREKAKEAIPDEKLRKEFYQEILRTGLEEGRIPEAEEAETILQKISQVV